MRRRKMIEDKKRSCRILVLVIAAMLIVTMMPATAAAASASGRWITKNGQKTAYVYAGGAKATEWRLFPADAMPSQAAAD
jgi:hypothetical protein